MEPVSPQTGAPEVVLAKHQPQYTPLPAAIYDAPEHGPTCQMYATRWTMTDEERLAVAEGADIFVTQLVFDSQRFAPLIVQVGPQWLTVKGEGNGS